MSNDHHSSELLPPFREQSLGVFLRTTWAGKILVVNTVVFVAMSLVSGSVMMPETETLVQFGAKIPVLIAQGEWWRFVTPMFVHIGLIHFLFNSYAIFLIGSHLEPLVGGRWFLLVYFLGGILGNVASAVFTLGISAGASSSLFALLGCGFVLERVIGKHIATQTGHKPRTGTYTVFILINLGIGFVIPVIDNAAHIGGLVGGVLLTFALLSLRPNRIKAVNRALGAALVATVVGLVGVGMITAASPTFIANKYREAGDAASDVQQSIAFYSQAMVLLPDDADLQFQRGKAFLFAGHLDHARYDLQSAVGHREVRVMARDLMIRLEEQGLYSRAEVLRDVLIN